ncbi:MAG: hypothetical protein R6X35_05615 [Candidatus Krumholzibacteriia bacterium]
MTRPSDRSWLRTCALLGAAVALILFPPVAAGKINVTIHGGDEDTNVEGDPIDSNDYGGGGGSHDDIQDYGSVATIEPRLPGLNLGRWLLVLVPDRSLGVPVFSFVVVERATLVGEGWDAR